ncbi:hypothetical protein PQR34_02925 [Paraburkholderia sediminicola]|uniref:hypothetical protein n=1 Tax=Paraburkholderia sediminicola TaxID=458836 RepID=UPI0038BD72C3
MKSKRLSVLSATAVALLALSGAAQAAGLCSNATLRGPYGFSAHGEVLGLLDASNTLHPFATPAILDDVSIFTFDGAGHFARTDFGNISGVPKGGQTAFNPNQSGTYTLNSDCTGSMNLVYSSGVVLGLEFVVDDDGSAVRAIISTETVPSAGPTPDNTTCPPSCAEGVQVSLEGKKVVVYGFR